MPFPFFGRSQNQNQQPRLTAGQRLIGMGANYLIPGAGILTNTAFRYRNNNTVGGIYNGALSGYSAADRAAINGPAITPNLGMPSGPNMGAFYGSPQQSGANVSNEQLQQQLEQYNQAQMQARIDAASGRQQGPQTGAGAVSAGNPFGAYRTRDETAQQRDARYAVESAFVNMRDSTNEAINAQQLAAAVRGRMA